MPRKVSVHLQVVNEEDDVALFTGHNSTGPGVAEETTRGSLGAMSAASRLPEQRQRGPIERKSVRSRPRSCGLILNTINLQINFSRWNKLPR